ncbi:MAG: hypothetical protein EOO47_23835 [Flavobacterium sp.]|nr:MAG: hypothetical protein EOO47_23835 [Flavobacterium sp.]
MKILIKLILLGGLLSIPFSNIQAQECKGFYSLSYISQKTKNIKKVGVTATFLTGWQLWQKYGEATYKSPTNLSFIFALVDFDNKPLLLKLFKGTGTSVYGSKSSPYANCDEIMLYHTITGVDREGTKSTLTKATF